MKIIRHYFSLLILVAISALLAGCGSDSASTPPTNNNPPPTASCRITVSGDSLAVFQSDLSACDVNSSGGAEVVFDTTGEPVGNNCQLGISNASVNSASGSCGSYRITAIPTEGSYRAAKPLSPYAANLTRCIFESPDIEDINEWEQYIYDNRCTLSEMPLVGKNDSDITVAAIMNQTQVTHPWMAERFEQLLEVMPQDLLNLFRGVTGVVIGSEIRPSYYWKALGAIYLDPADLWLTTIERNSISRAEDPRGEYSSQLQFNAFWDYLKDDDFAWDYFPLDGSGGNSRSLDDIVQPMAALLFHELAHANDNVPPQFLGEYNENQYFLNLLVALDPNSASATLDKTYPLQSDLLIELADVRSFGSSATTAQQALTATDIGDEFEPDGANDLYSYSLYYEEEDYRILSEDTAMLFEEMMMKYHFDVDRLVAFTDTGENFDDYTLRWGQVNRAGNDYVKERAALAIGIILGVDDTSVYLDSMPQPTALTEGISLGDSLLTYLNSQSTGQKAEKNRRAVLPRHHHRHHQNDRSTRLIEALRDVQ